jgi:hypothetical protein
MNSPIINIEPYSGNLLDPFSRFFIFIGGLIFCGWLIRECVVETSNIIICLTACFCAVIFICVVTIIVFTYTELDGRHIAYVFRIGKFCRFEHSSVRWAEVRQVELYRSMKPRTVDLTLTKINGTKINFSVSRYSKGEDRFDAIAHYFSEAKK